MINKITCSNPYSYTKLTNTAQKHITNTFRKCIGVPIAAIALTTSAPLVSSCVVDTEEEPDVTFFTCPHDSTEFKNVCNSTSDRISFMLQSLRIIPSDLKIDNIASILYTDGEKNVNLQNIVLNENGSVHFNKITKNNDGSRDTTKISCGNIQGRSLFIPVNESVIKNGQVVSENTKYIYQSALDKNTFLTKNSREEWLYALYPKAGNIVKQTPSGQKRTIKSLGYTKRP